MKKYFVQVLKHQNYNVIWGIKLCFIKFEIKNMISSKAVKEKIKVNENYLLYYLE